MRQRWLQLTLSILISVVLVWYAVRAVDFSRVSDILRHANYGWVAAAVLSATIIQYARVWRFGYLVRPFANADFSALFRIGNIGMFAIFALPVRLGEFVRPFMLKREYGASMSAGLGSVAAERVIDGLVVTLGFFVLTRSGVELPPAMGQAGIGALLVFAGAAVALGIVLFGHEKGASLLRKLVGIVSPSLADKLVGMLVAFADGLRALTNLRTLAAYMFFTLVFWFLSGVANFVLFRALGIPLSFPVAFVMTALTVIALMLPAGPGMIGTVQAAIVWGLTALGVDSSLAFAYSMLMYLSGNVVTVGFGLWSVLRSHVSMSTLVEQSQQEAT